MSHEALEKLGKRDLGPVALLFGIITLVFADVLFLGSYFFQRDLSPYFYPLRAVLRNAVEDGVFPSWNPYFSAGQPLAANPAFEVFYPPQWTILLGNQGYGVGLQIVFHIYVAAAGMYLLGRALGFGRFAAFFAALTFSCSGFFLSLIDLLPFQYALAWLPWFVKFLWQWLTRGRLRDAGAASSFLALVMLLGEPMIVSQIFLIGVALAAGFRRELTWGSRLRSIASVCLIFLVALMIAAVQLIPAFDFAADTARARGLTFSESSTWSMPAARPLELFFPALFGTPDLFWSARLYPERQVPYIPSLYFGVLAAVLAVSALIARTRGSAYVLLTTAVLFVFALGRYTPLYQLLYDWGFVTSLRYPEKFCIGAVFVLIVFAAKALDEVLKGDTRILRIATVCLSVLMVVSAGMTFWTFSNSYIHFLRLLWDPLPAIPPGSLRICRITWFYSLLMGGASLLALRLARRGDRVAHALIVLVLIVDVFPRAMPLVVRLPNRYGDAPFAVQALASTPEPQRLFHLAEWFTEDLQAFFRNPQTFVWSVRNGLFPRRPANWRIETVFERDFDRTVLSTSDEFAQSMWRVHGKGATGGFNLLLAMSNVRWVAGPRNFGPEDARGKEAIEEIQLVDFMPFPGNPRYYFASGLERIGTTDEFVQKVSGQPWDSRVAFVRFPPFKPAEGKILRAETRWNSFEVDVDAAERSFLVVSMTRHKYWEATIDGKKAQIQPANVSYQGLVVPKGPHHIRFEYHNPLFGYGAMVSSLGILVAAALIFSGGLRFRAGRKALIAADPASDHHHINEHSERIADNPDTAIRRVEP